MVERGEASRKAVRNLMKRFFQDSPELLILNVLEDEQLAEAEIDRLKRLIAGEGGGTLVNWLELANVAAAMAISTAVNSLWLGCCWRVLAGAAMRLLPRSNATTRYAIWLIALCFW